MAKEEEEKRLLEEDDIHPNHHQTAKNSVLKEVDEATVELDALDAKRASSPRTNNPSQENDDHQQQQHNQPPTATQNNDIKLNITTPPPPTQQASITKKIVAVLFWILFSALTLILNKLLFSVLSFPYPITLTMVHTIVCSILAFLVTCVFQWIPMVKQDKVRSI